jgi:hypothetical protein
MTVKILTLLSAAISMVMMKKLNILALVPNTRCQHNPPIMNLNYHLNILDRTKNPEEFAVPVGMTLLLNGVLFVLTRRVHGGQQSAGRLHLWGLCLQARSVVKQLQGNIKGLRETNSTIATKHP